MRIQNYINSIRRGLRRPEIRRHPIQAVSRRLRWRWHWRYSKEPIVLRNWCRGLSIALPHTGNSALLFYRTHSDPGLALFLQTALSPQMTFLDVGAHIGEFSLVAAKMVGREGRVLSVEPLPPCAEAIRRNAELNGFAQIKVYNGAMSDQSGKTGFLSDTQRSAGWMAKQADRPTFEAQCWTLDDFLSMASVHKAHVMKLDAGGNELAVLRGGEKSFCEGAVPTLALKMYHPDVTRERFGYDSRESLRLLHRWGFQLKLILREDAFPIFQPDDVDRYFDSLVYCHLIVATKI